MEDFPSLASATTPKPQPTTSKSHGTPKSQGSGKPKTKKSNTLRKIKLKDCKTKHDFQDFSLITSNHHKRHLQSLLRAQSGEDQGPGQAESEFPTIHTQLDATNTVRSSISFSEGARKILDADSVGRNRNAALSEALSLELLHRLYGARLLLAEGEISYSAASSKLVDYVCNLNGQRTAVSVTRAMFQHPTQGSLVTTALASDTAALCRALLAKKIEGLVDAEKNVVPKSGWTRSILHVWAPSFDVALLCHQVFCKLVEERNKKAAAAEEESAKKQQASDVQQPPASTSTPTAQQPTAQQPQQNPKTQGNPQQPKHQQPQQGDAKAKSPCSPVLIVTIAFFSCALEFSFLFGR